MMEKLNNNNNNNNTAAAAVAPTSSCTLHVKLHQMTDMPLAQLDDHLLGVVVQLNGVCSVRHSCPTVLHGEFVVINELSPHQQQAEEGRDSGGGVITKLPEGCEADFTLEKVPLECHHQEISSGLSSASSPSVSPSSSWRTDRANTPTARSEKDSSRRQQEGRTLLVDKDFDAIFSIDIVHYQRESGSGSPIKERPDTVRTLAQTVLHVNVRDVLYERTVCPFTVDTRIGELCLTVAVSNHDVNGFKERLTLFLQRHNPAGVRHVDDITSRVSELDVFTKLRKKYGVQNYAKRCLEMARIYGLADDGTMLQTLGNWEDQEEEFILRLVLENGPEPRDIPRSVRFFAFAHQHEEVDPSLFEALENMTVDAFEERMLVLARQHGAEPHPRSYLFTAKSCPELPPARINIRKSSSPSPLPTSAAQLSIGDREGEGEKGEKGGVATTNNSTIVTCPETGTPRVRTLREIEAVREEGSSSSPGSSPRQREASRDGSEGEEQQPRQVQVTTGESKNKKQSKEGASPQQQVAVVARTLRLDDALPPSQRNEEDRQRQQQQRQVERYEGERDRDGDLYSRRNEDGDGNHRERLTTSRLNEQQRKAEQRPIESQHGTTRRIYGRVSAEQEQQRGGLLGSSPVVATATAATAQLVVPSTAPSFSAPSSACPTTSHEVWGELCGVLKDYDVPLWTIMYQSTPQFLQLLRSEIGLGEATATVFAQERTYRLSAATTIAFIPFYDPLCAAARQDLGVVTGLHPVQGSVLSVLACSNRIHQQYFRERCDLFKTTRFHRQMQQQQQPASGVEKRYLLCDAGKALEWGQNGFGGLLSESDTAPRTRGDERVGWSLQFAANVFSEQNVMRQLAPPSDPQQQQQRVPFSTRQFTCALILCDVLVGRCMETDGPAPYSMRDVEAAEFDSVKCFVADRNSDSNGNGNSDKPNGAAADQTALVVYSPKQVLPRLIVWLTVDLDAVPCVHHQGVAAVRMRRSIQQQQQQQQRRTQHQQPLHVPPTDLCADCLLEYFEGVVSNRQLYERTAAAESTFSDSRQPTKDSQWPRSSNGNGVVGDGDGNARDNGGSISPRRYFPPAPTASPSLHRAQTDYYKCSSSSSNGVLPPLEYVYEQSQQQRAQSARNFRHEQQQQQHDSGAAASNSGAWARQQSPPTDSSFGQQQSTPSSSPDNSNNATTSAASAASAAKALMMQGWQQYRAGNIDQAGHLWRECHGSYERTAPVVALEAMGVYAEMVDRDFAAAPAYYRRALKAEPDTPSCLFRLANLLEARDGDLEGACALFQRAAQLGDAAAARREQILLSRMGVTPPK